MAARSRVDVSLTLTRDYGAWQAIDVTQLLYGLYPTQSQVELPHTGQAKPVPESNTLQLAKAVAGAHVDETIWPGRRSPHVNCPASAAICRTQIWSGRPGDDE
jgi:hypothetical protein